MWGKYKEYDYQDVFDVTREIYINYQVQLSQRKLFKDEFERGKRQKLS